MGFKAGNTIIDNKEVAPSKEGATPVSLTKMETEVLLHTLKNANFKGEMVEVIYTLVNKLKNNLTDV